MSVVPVLQSANPGSDGGNQEEHTALGHETKKQQARPCRGPSGQELARKDGSGYFFKLNFPKPDLLITHLDPEFPPQADLPITHLDPEFPGGGNVSTARSQLSACVRLFPCLLSDGYPQPKVSPDLVNDRVGLPGREKQPHCTERFVLKDLFHLFETE